MNIYLYDEPDAAGLDVDHLASWLQARLPAAAVEVRSDYLTHHLGQLPEATRAEVSEALGAALPHVEIEDLVNPADQDRLPPESPDSRGWDVLYEGVRLQALLGALLPASEEGPTHVHIVFTTHYLGQWPAGLALAELVALVPGQPHLLSVSGLIEGLQMPRQYHFLRQQMTVLGVDEELHDLDAQFAGDALAWGDARLNDALKGYLLAAVLQQLTGDLGCSDRRCRLYQATSHEELVQTQMSKHARLCPRHDKLLKSVGGVPE